MKSCINGATTMPYNLEQDIKSANTAGFKGVEIWVSKLGEFLKNHTEEDLRHLINDSEISAPSLCAFSGFIYCSEEEFHKKVQDLKALLEVGHDIKAEYMILCAEAFGDRRAEEAKHAYVSRMRRLSSVTNDYGIKIAMEWFWELPPAIDIIREIDYGNIGLVIDTFHWYRGDGNLENLKKVPSDKLFFMHVNDCEDLSRNKLTDKNRLYCGRGILPLLDVFSILKNKNYDGYLSVELFREEYWKKDPEEISNTAYKTLGETALRAGLSIS
jgi:2-keto-myo-inositol isomerase